MDSTLKVKFLLTEICSEGSSYPIRAYNSIHEAENDLKETIELGADSAFMLYEILESGHLDYAADYQFYEDYNCWLKADCSGSMRRFL